MKRSVVRARSGIALFLAAAALAAIVGLRPAEAGLVSLSASFEELDTNSLIFSGTGVAVGPGVEFSGIFVHFISVSSTWTLDVLDLGFTLTGTCSNTVVGCDFPSGAQLVLSDLVFAPPAALVGLLGISGDLSDVASPPVVTSSVVITFDAFTLGTGPFPATQSYSARFDLEPLSTVPVPAALLLVLAGGIGLGLLARARR